ncbi:cell wall-binding repeat-containing protein [Metaclostridioides mangenotii]|uniref:cell wall-binding repeat-containing protein n=1 Tax=Metaclostridioides mangenotii TaxID=1540 RepID=UPI0004889D61|nr:cell wall-binding repeat-containing protein [Clostridioides mangenotii]
MRKRKNLIKRLLSVGMAISFFIVSTAPTLAYTKDSITSIKKPEYTEQYKQYLEDVENGQVDKYNGRIPTPYRNEATEVKDNGLGISIPNYLKRKSSANLPINYDPRKLDLVTPVKDQDELGTCWTFTAMSSLESFLKYKNMGEYDFSEEHLKWWSTNGDYGWNLTDMTGASNYTAIGYLTSWMGPKLEEDIPYNGKVPMALGATRPSNMDTEDTQVNVTEVVHINDNRESMKNSILEYGAIISGYGHYNRYLSQNKSAYNCNVYQYTNHTISIIGWDDNYSKDNFNPKYKPQSNGAWLAKNSWGPYNSEGGYLWISYEDRTLMSDNDNFAIRNVEMPDDSKKIYQHEYAGIAPLVSEKITAANVFDFSSESEVLDSVTFMSDSIGSKYNIYYAPVVGDIPQKDRMVRIGGGNIEFSGYTNAKVDTYKIPKGKGAIVVEIDGEGTGNVSIFGETEVKGYSGLMAKANLGESYILEGDKFKDVNSDDEFYPTNFTIKAVTKNTSYRDINKESLVGADRYETSVKISKKGWTNSENVVLVNGEAIPDALSATPYAASLNSPVLLTEKNNLTQKTAEEIKRLGAKNIYIVGGENSVSKSIEDKLNSSGFKVERISGEDRYKTSMKLAYKLNDKKRVSKIAVVNGVGGLADAISIGAPAGENNIPIILADPSSQVKDLDEFEKIANIEKSYVVGGTSSLSTDLEGKLKNPTRLSGENRNVTNAEIIEHFYKDSSSGSKYNNLYVVKDGTKSSGDLIDGLSVGALGSKSKSPIVLVGNKLVDEQKSALKQKTFTSATQVGGGANRKAFAEVFKLIRLP